MVYIQPYLIFLQILSHSERHRVRSAAYDPGAVRATPNPERLRGCSRAAAQASTRQPGRFGGKTKETARKFDVRQFGQLF